MSYTTVPEQCLLLSPETEMIFKLFINFLSPSGNNWPANM